MNTLRFLQGLSYLIGFSLIVSCQDRLPEVPVRFRLSRIQSTDPDNILLDHRVRTFTLQYDGAGRLTSYIERNAEADIRTTTLAYNTQSQLIHIDSRPIGAASINRTEYDFNYDSFSRLQMVRTYAGPVANANISLVSTNTYEYDTANDPVRVLYVNALSPNITVTRSYSINQGNIVRTVTSGAPIINNLTYDDKPNPFRGQLIYQYGILQPRDVGLISYNRNNPTVIGAESQRLTYNQQGLLSKWEYGSIGSQHYPYYTYEYEAY